MALKHPEYAHGISDEELIKEAIEFCDEELDSYNGIEYDDDAEVCCQRSNTFIREFVRRLKNIKNQQNQPVAYVCAADMHLLISSQEGLDLSISPKPRPDLGMNMPLYIGINK